MSVVLPHVSCAVFCDVPVVYALSERTTEALPLLTQTREHMTAGRHGGDHGGTRSRTLAELSEGLLLVGRVEDASALAEHLRELSRTHPGRGPQAQGYSVFGEGLKIKPKTS